MFLPLVAMMAGLLFCSCEKEESNNQTTSQGEDDPDPDPSVTGGFSVSENLQVFFSPGNLQWSAKGGGSMDTTHIVVGGGTAPGIWRFSPNQWDVIGADNSNISSSYSGWIDLFGWGTSEYLRKYPYMTSQSDSDYGNGERNISGTKYDWGVFNAIYNTKTNTTDSAGTWRTLTRDEWEYLINTRTTTSGIRYAKAIVNGVSGLVLVPDNWSNSTYALDSTNTADATFGSNVITTEQWAVLENADAVFLPIAGYRYGTTVDKVDFSGHYWSSTNGGISLAYHMTFFNDNVYTDHFGGQRQFGFNVRLVRNVIN